MANRERGAGQTRFEIISSFLDFWFVRGNEKSVVGSSLYATTSTQHLFGSFCAGVRARGARVGGLVRVCWLTLMRDSMDLARILWVLAPSTKRTESAIELLPEPFGPMILMRLPLPVHPPAQAAAVGPSFEGVPSTVQVTP